MISMFSVNLYDKNKYEENPIAYLIENYGLINPIIKVKKVKIQACISFDNMLCHLGGKDSGGSQISYRPGVQLVLGYDKNGTGCPYQTIITIIEADSAVFY